MCCVLHSIPRRIDHCTPLVMRQIMEMKKGILCDVIAVIMMILYTIGL